MNIVPVLLSACPSVCLSVCCQMFDGIKPTLGELEKFEATPEEVEVEG